MTIGHRITVATAAQTMLQEAAARVRQLPADDPSHAFYSGVETAALHELHFAPLGLRIDDHSWLCTERGPFQSGYLKATSGLRAAHMTADERSRVPLPEPS